MRDGLDGLWDIASGRRRKPIHDIDKIAAIVDAALQTKPEGMTHLNCRTMAQSQGVAVEAMKTDYFHGEAHDSLLQRFATPKEIADQVVFLCSANASAINGAAQRVEGGIIRSMM